MHVLQSENVVSNHIDFHLKDIFIIVLQAVEPEILKLGNNEN
jgi:hypothetical protein